MAWVPSRNPFLNRRVMVFMYRMRPVPTVRRPLAFCPQLKFLIFLLGYPQEAQVFFWMWYDTLPHRRQEVWDLLCLRPNEVVPLVCWCQKVWGGGEGERRVSRACYVLDKRAFPQIFNSIASNTHGLEYPPASIGRGHGRATMGTRARVVPPSVPFQPQPPEPITRHVQRRHHRATSLGAELRHAIALPPPRPPSFKHRFIRTRITPSSPTSQLASQPPR